MWESIKNKFKRKKHVEEVEEAVVNEEEQAEEKTEALAGDENTTDKSYEPDMAVESTESKDTDDSETEEKNLQEIKPDDISDDAKEKEETVSENLKNDEEVIYETSEKEKETASEILESEGAAPEIPEENTEENKPEKSKKRGFFGKLIDGLTKTRDSFVSGLENVFSGFSEIDEDFYEELEEVLIMADIGVATTEKIIENLQEKVKENKIKEVAVCRQLLVDSIKEQMRVHDDAYDFENKKSVVMLIGVNGVGKTTSVGKLASQFKSDGKKVILAAADTFRAAAIEQLTEWSNRAGVELIAGQEGGDPAAVVYDAVNAAKARNADILVCDTAGRLHNKKNLMEELKKINRIVEREYPDACRETFVVLDGTTGQNALAQARQFSEVADITGIILTKLDGTAKGGIAIAIQSEMNIPVKYIGIGEHIEDLQKFDADAFVDALFETKG
jgi:signal recognition particle-docking protein ftsY